MSILSHRILYYRTLERWRERFEARPKTLTVRPIGTSGTANLSRNPINEARKIKWEKFRKLVKRITTKFYMTLARNLDTGPIRKQFALRIVKTALWCSESMIWSSESQFPGLWLLLLFSGTIICYMHMRIWHDIIVFGRTSIFKHVLEIITEITLHICTY